MLYAKKFSFTETELAEGYSYRQLTPLHFAAECGHAEVIKAILATEGVDKKALLTKKNNSGDTPLHLAARDGHTAVLAEMLKHPKGLEALSVKDLYDHTPLHLAAFNGHTDALAAMLQSDKGLEALSAQNNDGWTALHAAALMAHTAALAAIAKHKETMPFFFVQNSNAKTAYDILTEPQKLELAQQMGTSFEVELPDLDKNRLLQSISTHLSTDGSNHTIGSMFKTNALDSQLYLDDNKAEITYLKERDRLLEQVINYLNSKSSDERQK